MKKNPVDKSVPPASPLESWAGEFGDDYISRNEAGEEAIGARVRLWTRILGALRGAAPAAIVEVGSNIGLNLRALRRCTDSRLIAVEPNARARARLIEESVVEPRDALEGIAAKLPLADGAAELVFTSGVLIHVPPEDLGASCDEIFRVSSRYVACIEYFADQPEERRYRGRSGLLFKRDFGDFWLTRHPQLEIVDYGFCWRRATGLDNLTWWLFEKPGASDVAAG